MDAAGAEYGESTAPLLEQLQHVDRPNEVVLDQPAAAGLAGHPGEDTAVGGSFDNPIAARRGFEVARAADAAMIELDAKFPQDAAIHLASGPDKVVQTDKFPVRPAFPQAASHGTADETTDYGG